MYKRQAQVVQQRNEGETLLVVLFRVKAGHQHVIPVSYTHLDVYKRQDLLNGADVEAPDLRGGAALVIAALQAQGSTRVMGAEPVSYTHLDVYKRQHARRAADAEGISCPGTEGRGAGRTRGRFGKMGDRAA